MRSADDVERIVRANLAQGVHNFFITDDNLARNQNWEAIFDRLIKMREEEGLRIQLIAQVDTMCHKIRGFIEKAGRAGVNRVFIGMENINPEALKEARKGQNRITEYRTMLQAWHRAAPSRTPAISWGFPATRLTRSSVTSASSSASFPSTCWNSSSLRRCRAPRITSTCISQVEDGKRT